MINAELLTALKPHIQQFEEFISQCESLYFTGALSAGTIKADLETRRARDRYSTMGSNPYQTNLVSEKKQFYFEDFDRVEKDLKMFLDMLQKADSNHTLIPRFKRCEDQIDDLRKLVQNF